MCCRAALPVPGKRLQGSSMKKVVVAFGTRPEAIKMAPVVKELQKHSAFETTVVVTAQHREMLDQVLELFQITPDFDLDIMRSSQSLEQITSRVLEGMAGILREVKPDIVLVQGDTTTTFATALSAFYQRIPVGHVEAGLRTGNPYSPYPEEMNRRITTALSTLHFAPTELNRQNLLDEGVRDDTIFITGNTVIDALFMVVDPSYRFDPSVVDIGKVEGKRLILLTCHRRENWGTPMQEIFAAIRDTLGNKSGYEIVFPVHLNPEVKEAAHKAFGSLNNIQLVGPLRYEAFSNLMSKSYLILSDSGGVQEEAPSLGAPVLVLRDTTERPEAIEAGTVKLAGITYQEVVTAIQEILNNQELYDIMSQAKNPYGDGTASMQIAKALF